VKQTQNFVKKYYFIDELLILKYLQQNISVSSMVLLQSVD